MVALGSATAVLLQHGNEVDQYPAAEAFRQQATPQTPNPNPEPENRKVEPETRKPEPETRKQEPQTRKPNIGI